MKQITQIFLEGESPTLNYIIIDQRKLLTVFRSVVCEIQRNQSNLLTFKN